MTLQFESELSGAVRSSVPTLQNVEKIGCEALMGDERDVATGSFVGFGEAALIWVQNATLIRSEGDAMSSIIVDGMSRTVEVLVFMVFMGLWRDGDSDERC
jgi:hypothetical protein